MENNKHNLLSNYKFKVIFLNQISNKYIYNIQLCLCNEIHVEIEEKLCVYA